MKKVAGGVIFGVTYEKMLQFSEREVIDGTSAYVPTNQSYQGMGPATGYLCFSGSSLQRLGILGALTLL